MCDLATEVLARSPKAISFTIVDIAHSEQLMEKYGIKIPVLYCSKTGNELCWPFDDYALQGWYRSLHAAE